MKYIFLTILLFPFILQAQDIPTLEPKTGNLLKFDTSLEPFLELRENLYQKGERTDKEEKLLDSINSFIGDDYDISVYETEGPGCSWYCGGGPYKIISSSNLKSNGSINYNAENIHDFSYKTVWAEGADGYGIGEYVEYHFKAQSPRITEIRFANGYVKTDQAWFDNSRVKSIKMYVNGQPFAILNLNDTRAIQYFTLKEPLGRNNGENDWVLKFEIIDVYKGDKYKDVVISELSFDGTDVH